MSRENHHYIVRGNIANKNLHIDALELSCVVFNLKLFGHIITGRKILIFSDNYVSDSFKNKSMLKRLQAILLVSVI